MRKITQLLLLTLLLAIPSNGYALQTIYGDVNNDGEVNIADVNTIIDIILGGQSETYVDLGLPSGTKWATRNVGANSPEESGDYFAWGETSPKWNYSYPYYRWCLSGKETWLTKYCTNGLYSYYGTYDNKSELDLEDDAAYVNWGPSWRMPTTEQIQELIDNCTWTLTTQNDVRGKLVTGPNGNTIFLPCVGYRWSQNLTYNGTSGYYWSRTLDTGRNCNAGCLSFNYSGEASCGLSARCDGLSVRAVRVFNDSLHGDVNNDGEVNIADINTVIDIILGGHPQQQNSIEVDLGLPSGTIWASHNVGANSPEGKGDFFAWGETAPKENYNWGTYKWSNHSNTKLNKYCTDSVYGTVDNKTELDPEDDAAYVNWGPSWRIPTYDQLDELKMLCNWTWTMQKGVNGYLVTGPNGNSLFLPAAGDWLDGSYNTGSGFIWSRSLDQDNPVHAYNLFFGSNEVSWNNYTREHGLSVRAVSVSKADFYIEKRSIDFGLVPIGEICSDELTIVNNSTEDISFTASVESPFSIILQDEIASSMTITLPSQSSIPLTVMFNDSTPGEFNSNLIIQKLASNGGQFVIPVHVLAYVNFSTQQEVDLGLPSGTLWASCNVGANSQEEYGDYFAWGETSPKSSYGWSNYRWANGRFNALTKYVTNGSYGYRRDNISELELADDAARVNMGSPWRIPTPDQISELKGKCTWVWMTINGVNGYLVIGPNYNTIFLPAAGYYDYSTLKQKDTNGYFWSNKINITRPCEASFMSFNSPGGPSSSTLYDSGRSTGLTVRAVHR